MEETPNSKKSEESVTSKWVVSGVCVLIALLVMLVSVIFSDNAAKYFGNLLGTKDMEHMKMETIQLIGWAISGVFVAIGLASLIQRVDAQMGATKAQAAAATAQAGAARAQAAAAEAQAENNRLVEKGHRQERFKTATEHLGNDRASVRIAAFYEFLHLIKDDGEEYRKSILEILYAHIRTITDNFTRREDVKDAEEKGESIKLTEEIQGLLDILFKSQDINRSDITPNLQRVYFSGADLASGDLSGVNLSDADLSGANLSGADLSGVNLSDADLFGANLSDADLSGAYLSNADLSRANLPGANLSGANLLEANLSKANLSGAKLPEANLSRAKLSGAKLPKANLSGVNLSGADLSREKLLGAKLPKGKFFETDLSGVNLSGAMLCDTDLSDVILSGANLSGAKFFETDLSDADLSDADLSGAILLGADLSGADLSNADLSNALLDSTKYTNKTTFPEWLVPLIVLPNNDDEVQFPEGFRAPKKPKFDE